MSGINRWYIATTTPTGYKRFGARVMYMKRSCDQVIVMYEKAEHLVTPDEARELFNRPDLVPRYLQKPLDDLLAIIHNN